jgi:stress response protein SCP2
MQDSDMHFTADAEDGRAIVKQVKSSTFGSRLARWLGREGVHVKEAEMKVGKVESHALEQVQLDLEWGFPGASQDYLDGICMAYAEDACVSTVDYRGHKPGSEVPKDAITHSGDLMHDGGGRHRLLVQLSKVPHKVTELYFLLSAYNCGDLALFKKPSINFIDGNSQAQLATYTSVPCSGVQACVLAALQRSGSSWRVLAHGRSATGTVRDYAPILDAIFPFQVHYANFRRRFWLVRLHALATGGRLATRARSSGESQLLERIFDEVPDMLFRSLVMCL